MDKKWKLATSSSPIDTNKYEYKSAINQNGMIGGFLFIIMFILGILGLWANMDNRHPIIIGMSMILSIVGLFGAFITFYTNSEFETHYRLKRREDEPK